MKFREFIDKIYGKITIGVWGLIGFGGFLFLGLLISQINAIDLLGCDYKWINHAVSELGMVSPENWSWLLFNICLILGGVFGFFFILGFSFYFEGKYAASIAKIGLILGFIWALTLIGVGLNPADVRNVLHYNVSITFFVSSMIMIAIFGVAILMQHKEKNRQKFPRCYSILSFIVSLIFFVLLFQDPATGASLKYLIPGICREEIIPCLFWEWISFYSLALWGIIFSILTLKKNTKKILNIE